MYYYEMDFRQSHLLLFYMNFLINNSCNFIFAEYKIKQPLHFIFTKHKIKQTFLELPGIINSTH